MSAEATLYDELVSDTALADLVDVRIYDSKFPAIRPGQRDISFPCCVFQRVSTQRVQVVTGAVVARSIRFQIDCLSESSVEAATVAEAVEDALVAAIGSFIDVTLGSEDSQWNDEAGLYSRTVECECLEAA